MKQITLGDFKRLRKAEIVASLPFELLADGSPIAVIASVAGVIVIEDLHPRVQNQLKAKEKLARSGMPMIERVHADEILIPVSA